MSERRPSFGQAVVNLLTAGGLILGGKATDVLAKANPNHSSNEKPKASAPSNTIIDLTKTYGPDRATNWQGWPPENFTVTKTPEPKPTQKPTSEPTSVPTTEPTRPGIDVTIYGIDSVSVVTPLSQAGLESIAGNDILGPSIVAMLNKEAPNDYLGVSHLMVPTYAYDAIKLNLESMGMNTDRLLPYSVDNLKLYPDSIVMTPTVQKDGKGIGFIYMGDNTGVMQNYDGTTILNGKIHIKKNNGDIVEIPNSQLNGTTVAIQGKNGGLTYVQIDIKTGMVTATLNEKVFRDWLRGGSGLNMWTENPRAKTTETVSPKPEATDIPPTLEYKAGIPATINECNLTPTTPEQWKQYNAVLKEELGTRKVSKIDIYANVNSFGSELPHSYYEIGVPAENILGCSIEKDSSGKPVSLTMDFTDGEGRILHAQVTNLQASEKFTERYKNNPQEVVDGYNINKVIEGIHNGKLKGFLVAIFAGKIKDSTPQEIKDAWAGATKILNQDLEEPIEVVTSNGTKDGFITKMVGLLANIFNGKDRNFSDQTKKDLFDALEQPGKVLPSPMIHY